MSPSGPQRYSVRLKAHTETSPYEARKTIYPLAQVIRERDVSLGLRDTLVAQAQRLELLARRRAVEIRGEMPDTQVVEETRGRSDEEQR